MAETRNLPSIASLEKESSEEEIAGARKLLAAARGKPSKARKSRRAAKRRKPRGP